MNKPTKSLVVPTIITCTLVWGWFASHAIEECKMDSTNESLDAVNLIEKIKESTFTSRVDLFYIELERLKEEERKRLEELERQRLERLEKIRLAKIEEAKKIAEQKRIEELKKQQQQEKVISRGSDSNVGNWMTFNATYYGNDCNGCGNYTYTGINVSDTISYKGYRIVASDKNVLPMGTLVEIKTPNERFKGIIADVGGGIHGERLDILVSSEAVANQIGRHDVQVRVIGKMNIN